jgi:uncharacterized protein (DUF924 family)
VNPAREVLDFWFAPAGTPEYGKSRRVWFAKDPAFDAEIRDRFEPLHRRALAGELDTWQEAPVFALALTIVLDQFPRNMYRDDARAYAADAKALAVAERAVLMGYDTALRPVQRQFLYLPFEHAEDPRAQARAVDLFEGLAQFAETADTAEWARRHQEVIERFGRFPHRNQALGRASTPEESAYLIQPGSRF